jgi:hypothetical protein
MGNGGVQAGTPAIVLVFGEANVIPWHAAIARTMEVLIPLALTGPSKAHWALAATGIVMVRSETRIKDLLTSRAERERERENTLTASSSPPKYTDRP